MVFWHLNVFSASSDSLHQAHIQETSGQGSVLNKDINMNPFLK
jgi:hypothetical protein